MSSQIKLLTVFLLTLMSTNALAARCLYVSSYHKGYEWSDGIERGIDTVLQGRCDIDKFYMDTKRNTSEAFGKMMGQRAREYIDETKPDIVIACDDNASRYLVAPFYRNATLPIVFCGINYNADVYGYPYDNVTGMIEIAPVRALMKVVQKTVRTASRGIYLSVDIHSQHKEYELNKKVYSQAGIELDRILVTDMDEWIDGFIEAQRMGDFVIVGSNGGLNDWDKERAQDTAMNHVKVLTVTNMEWMIHYAMLAMTKVAEEQGEWAAEAALEILAGTKPADIPVVVNRRWDIYVNPPLLEAARIQLPGAIMHKAVKIRG